MLPTPTAEEGFTMPKIEPKMLLFPALMLISRQIDFKNEKTVDMARQAFFAALAGVITVYYILYRMVEGKKDEREVYVPPKAPPSLPFGPKPAPPTKDQYVKCTIHEHEISLLKTAMAGVGMSGVIAIVMSYKFSIHGSLFMQMIMMPVGITDVGVFYRYFLGWKTKSDGTPLYGELDELPEDLPTEAVEDELPRVEELVDEDEVVPVKETKKTGIAEPTKVNETTKPTATSIVSEPSKVAVGDFSSFVNDASALADASFESDMPELVDPDSGLGLGDIKMPADATDVDKLVEEGMEEVKADMAETLDDIKDAMDGDDDATENAGLVNDAENAFDSAADSVAEEMESMLDLADKSSSDMKQNMH